MDYSEDIVRRMLGYEVLYQVAKSEPCGVIQGGNCLDMTCIWVGLFFPDTYEATAVSDWRGASGVAKETNSIRAAAPSQLKSNVLINIWFVTNTWLVAIFGQLKLNRGCGPAFYQLAMGTPANWAMNMSIQMSSCVDSPLAFWSLDLLSAGIFPRPVLRHTLVGANGSADWTTDPQESEISRITDHTHMQMFRASHLSMINDIN